jgi:hypothetical protein
MFWEEHPFSEEALSEYDSKNLRMVVEAGGSIPILSVVPGEGESTTGFVETDKELVPCVEASGIPVVVDGKGIPVR